MFSKFPRMQELRNLHISQLGMPGLSRPVSGHTGFSWRSGLCHTGGTITRLWFPCLNCLGPHHDPILSALGLKETSFPIAAPEEVSSHVPKRGKEQLLEMQPEGLSSTE